MKYYSCTLVLLALTLALPSGALLADTFGSGANAFTIDFVTIGSPGNAQNLAPLAGGSPAVGAVPYEYRMGKYEISEQMIDKANALGGLGITKDTRGPDKPATNISWFEAARFVNWLNTSSGSVPAYKFDNAGAFQLWAIGDPGYNPSNLFRNSRARYFLPSIDEWHKAAYFDPVSQNYFLYPTGSNSVPDGINFVGDTVFDAVFFDGGNQLNPNDITNVGIASPNRAFGLGGNVEEWDETAFDRMNSNPLEHRRASGGSWQTASGVLNATNSLGGANPLFQGNFIGFRISSSVPEPNSAVLIAISVAVLIFVRPLKRKRIQNSIHSRVSRPI